MSIFFCFCVSIICSCLLLAYDGKTLGSIHDTWSHNSLYKQKKAINVMSSINNMTFGASMHACISTHLMSG